jgi:rhodanese-related sulfurtransferase
MRYTTVALFGVLMLVLPACWAAKEKKDGLFVINVLDKDLYDDCHIAGSINVPFEMIEDLEEALGFNLDRDNAQLVVYCSNYQCSTSEYAARKLCSRFKNVWVYEGGTAEWFQKGLPTEGPRKQAYLKKPCRQLSRENSGVSSITAKELAQMMGVDPDQKKAA